MDPHTLVGIIAGIVYTIGYLPYIREVRSGTTKPNLASWIGWSFVLLIGSAAQIAKGASWSVLLPIAALIGDMIVTILAFRKGYVHFSVLDKTCLGLGVAAILLWLITNEPLTALILAVSADFIVGVPTFVKTFKDPLSEGPMGWGFFALGSLLAFGATAQFDINNLAYPVEFVLLNGIVFFFALRGRLKTV